MVEQAEALYTNVTLRFLTDPELERTVFLEIMKI